MFNSYLINIKLYVFALLIILCDDVLDAPVVLSLLNKRGTFFILIETVISILTIRLADNITKNDDGKKMMTGNYWPRFIAGGPRNPSALAGSPYASKRNVTCRK